MRQGAAPLAPAPNAPGLSRVTRRAAESICEPICLPGLSGRSRSHRIGGRTRGKIGERAPSPDTERAPTGSTGMTGMTGIDCSVTANEGASWCHGEVSCAAQRLRRSARAPS